MKQLINSDLTQPGFNSIFLNKTQISYARFRPGKEALQSSNQNRPSFLAPELWEDIRNGNFPDLEKVCNNLINTFRANYFPFKATQFLEVLNQVQLTPKEVKLILNHPSKRHVLVENELIKIVLIHWTTNACAPVHGHPEGGCAFKVLSGSLVEKRYSPDNKLTLLANCKYRKGATAYLDDSMAFHSVENPFQKPAISLHVYTPGIRR